MNRQTAFFFSFIASVALSGCAAIAPPPPASPSGTAQADFYKDAKGRKVKDEIAKYAVGAPPGSIGSVILKNETRYVVRVGFDYVAAAGDNCRRILIESSTTQSALSAVCLVDGVWETVLWP